MDSIFQPASRCQTLQSPVRGRASQLSFRHGLEEIREGTRQGLSVSGVREVSEESSWCGRGRVMGKLVRSGFGAMFLHQDLICGWKEGKRKGTKDCHGGFEHPLGRSLTHSSHKEVKAFGAYRKVALCQTNHVPGKDR